MSDLLVALTLGTALGSGLTAGAFFAFSSFVMKALARLTPAEGTRAMQAINIEAPTPVFMTALFGTGLACATLAIWGLVDWDDSYSPWLLAGAVVYIVGTPVLTIVYHVPRNNALARADADTDEAARLWQRYLVEWTRANHLRTVAPLAAAAALTIALHVG
jgi:uncharacterized membrane protein